MTKLTLEKYISKASDGELIDVYIEILSGIVPATGYAHSFCRKVNRMIDAGEMCINTTSYRKVYLPTLNKAVQKELAKRYIYGLLEGRVDNTQEVRMYEESECEC